MDTRTNERYDPQAVPALYFCPHCGGEIYPDDPVYLFDGRPVHEDCLAGYAEARCRRALARELACAY